MTGGRLQIAELAMHIVFDPEFDQGFWPGPLRDGLASAGEEWAGPGRLLAILETALGLGGPWLSLPERAGKLVPAVRSTDGFWSVSAEVDPFGTARQLLEWRDALAVAGWRGGGKEQRLAALSALTAEALPGLPDRLHVVNDALARRDPDVESVELLSPRSDLEPLWQRTLALLETHGTSVKEREPRPAPKQGDTDLAAVKAARFLPRGDGTLRLLRPVGPLAAAEETAAWLATREDRAGVVVVGSDAVLDGALHRHGLPTSGAASDARDSVLLQVLPLVLDLGWSTQDPQRAYELLSLATGPVPGEVRAGLRRALEEWPAVDSDVWRQALADGLAAVESAARRERVRERLEAIWGARVERNGGRYPAPEAMRRAGILRQWLIGRISTTSENHSEWRAAAAQCERLLNLLRDSGLSELTPAQLRRFVVEATRGTEIEGPFPPQAGVGRVGSPGGVAGAARIVVWWRFDEASAPKPVRLPLTRAERADLESLGVALPDPGRVSAAHARRWRRPLEHATEALLLICPERDARGDDLYPHPLWDEIVARVDAKNTRRVAEQALMRRTLADVVPQTQRVLLALPAPRREWTVSPGRIARREKESPSSVETLLGCPLQWTLRYAGRLLPSGPAEVEDRDSVRLLGAVLHAVLNRLFSSGALDAKAAGREAGTLFDREGPRLAASLFLPGADSLREHVRRAAVGTATVLYELMAARNLRVLATEQTLSGPAFETTFEGRPDLIIGDPARILDLKWSGLRRRYAALAAGTALQLASYAYLKSLEDGAFPPVAYFIMESRKLLTTQPDAFHDAIHVDGPGPEETWRALAATHADEWKTVSAGRLEARGILEDPGAKPLEDAQIVGGRVVVPPACHWCDYPALCGRAFAKEW